MTERTSFYRKLAYMGAIVVLAFPIVWLSMPARISKEAGTQEAGKFIGGGKLAQLREEYRLAQVNLGEVDPASETIKLATLGLRPVAVIMLWKTANEAKMKEDWTKLTATLDLLSKLQPNFITFWKFQAWNITYNVSVEFDDYHDRFYYVREGINFLQKGVQYNLDNPQLLWDLGWFIGQKIGRADEYVQYRRLFKQDDDFHPADRTMEERDNWLVGKEWYKKAIEAVDVKKHSLGRKSPREFYSSPAKSQMNYAEAIEEEGFFDRARRAWQKAADEWREFGKTIVEHSTGVKLQLGTQPELEKEVAALRAKLDGMGPDVRKKLVDEKRQALKPEERQILDTPRESLKPEQAEPRAAIDAKMVVTDRDVAQRIARDQPEKANQAQQLASEIERQDTTLQYTINYKRDANYDYWQNRADFEQTPDALAAREFMHKGRKAFQNSDPDTAKILYQEGFAKWRKVIDAFPLIMDDEQTLGGDILDFVRDYRKVLNQFEERLGEDFPLWDVIEKFDRESNFTEELAAHQKQQKQPAGASTTPPTQAPAPENDAAKAAPDVKAAAEESTSKSPPKESSDSKK